MFEYWQSVVVDGNYLVSHVETGELEEANGFVREFASVAEVLAAYPSAALCEDM